MAALESSEPQGSNWTQAQLAEELSNPAAVMLVLEDGGRFAGHAIAWFAAEEAEIMTISVMPGSRKKGLGRRLLHSLLDARPWDRALLEVRASNLPALSFYRSEGFREVGRRRAYYRNGEDALLMRLEGRPNDGS